jgi:hypothetical protein
MINYSCTTFQDTNLSLTHNETEIIQFIMEELATLSMGIQETNPSLDYILNKELRFILDCSLTDVDWITKEIRNKGLVWQVEYAYKSLIDVRVVSL